MGVSESGKIAQNNWGRRVGADDRSQDQLKDATEFQSMLNPKNDSVGADHQRATSSPPQEVIAAEDKGSDPGSRDTTRHWKSEGKEGPWVSGAGPVTSGNRVEAMKTGKQTFDHIEESIKSADESVYITAWWLFEPTMMLDRDDPNALPLGELLQEKGKALSKAGKPGVKILMDENWPALAAVGAKNANLLTENSERVDFAADLLWLHSAAAGKFEGVELVFAPMHPDHPGAVDDIFTHHQKSVVVDSEKAYVLGQNFRDVDWDVSGHPVEHPDRPHTGPRQDVGVVIEGPAVEYVEENFVKRWNAVEGNENQLVVNKYEGQVSEDGVEIQVLRTQMLGESDIHKARLNLIANAKDYIYIEDQYSREPEAFKAIADRLEENEDLKVVLITNPDDAVWSPSAGYTEECLDMLKPYMEGDSPRVSMFQLESSQRTESFFGLRNSVEYENISLHSKVMIVDDQYVLQGSANMNTRSSYHDSELDVLISGKTYAKGLREALWESHAENYELPVDDVSKSIEMMRASALANEDNKSNKELLSGHLLDLDRPDNHRWKNIPPKELY